jgi:integrase
MKFTKQTAASLALPSGKSEQFFWDDTLPGFGVRMRASGAQWTIQYRVGTKQRRESLGDIRQITLDAARDIARTRFASVQLGNDPAADKAKKRAADAAVKLTFGKVAEQYVAFKRTKLEKGDYRQSTFKALNMYLNNHWSTLSPMPIETITQSVVALLLTQLTAKHGEIAAARARSNLSAVFTWAMKNCLCERNPVLATLDPGEDAEPRDRVLSDKELVTIWNTAGGGDDFSKIVRLLILTGCRRDEIGGLSRQEIDFDAGSFCISGKRTKNHKDHSLPLPETAMDILRSVPAKEGRDFVFGGSKEGFNAWSYSTIAFRERVTTAAGKALAHYTLHDLRRTMRTGLGKIGIPPHIAELVINHRKGGVEAIYDRFKYDGEIKAALARWADHVLALTEGKESNVVSLRA